MGSIRITRVRKNIAFPLRTQRVPGAEIEKKVAWASQLLGIDHLLDRRPRQLSGGERQRVALARALVREPTALLLDEPLSNLDAKLRASARQEIKQFQQRVGVTTIYVTHDQVEAMGMGDRIAVIDHGRVRQVGTPTEIYDDPADRFVATFVGTPPMNLVAHNGGYLGFRPENFLPREMIDDGNGNVTEFSFRVDRSEYLGSERIVYGVIEGFDEAGDHGKIAAGACRRGEHPARRVASPLPCATSALRHFDKDGKRASPPLKTGFRRWPQLPNQSSPSRFRVFASSWTGARCSARVFVSPAILYVLLLVGVPFLLAVYYSLSAYTIYDPSWRFVGLANFQQILQIRFSQTLGNTFLFTFGSQLLGLVLGKFGALLLLRPFPGRKVVRALIILPWAVPIALATVAWEWMFDSLYSVINWTMIALGIINRSDAPNWLGSPHLAMLCVIVVNAWRFFPFAIVDLPRRHHCGPAGRDRRCDRRRRGLLAPQLPDHPADDPSDRGHRPDFRHRVHVHRPFDRLSPDQWRSCECDFGTGLPGFPGRHRLRRRVAWRGHLAVHVAGAVRRGHRHAALHPAAGDLT